MQAVKLYPIRYNFGVCVAPDFLRPLFPDSPALPVVPAMAKPSPSSGAGLNT